MMGIMVREQSLITEAPRLGRENALLQVSIIHISPIVYLCVYILFYLRPRYGVHGQWKYCSDSSLSIVALSLVLWLYIYFLQSPGLFDGCELFFPSSFITPQPSKEDLVRLVKMAGGTVLGREPRARGGASNPTTCPYHAKPDSLLSTCHSIIVSNCSTDTCWEKNTGTAQAPPSWILDCLSHFQLLDISY